MLGLPGVCPKTLRALSLIAELVYGEETSIRDPARFSFAHGGKDGYPYPVDRQTYDETIATLEDWIDRSRVDRSEKVKALKRLASFGRSRDTGVHGGKQDWLKPGGSSPLI